MSIDFDRRTRRPTLYLALAEAARVAGRAPSIHDTQGGGSLTATRWSSRCRSSRLPASIQRHCCALWMGEARRVGRSSQRVGHGVDIDLVGGRPRGPGGVSVDSGRWSYMHTPSVGPFIALLHGGPGSRPVKHPMSARLRPIGLATPGRMALSDQREP